MKLTIRLKKRKKPISEFERLAQAQDGLKKRLFLYSELVKLYITFGRVRATPAKEIKKTKLRQIFKEAEKIKAKMEG